jgi:hypothetical protein
VGNGGDALVLQVLEPPDQALGMGRKLDDVAVVAEITASATTPTRVASQVVHFGKLCIIIEYKKQRLSDAIKATRPAIEQGDLALNMAT